ncbi:MAG: hypothetical protein ACFFDW_11845 [Candidatus Thorarchaeota archaeon]
MTKDSAQRRTLRERVEDIFKFIDLQDDVFPKSRLKEIGLNPTVAENWLDLIVYIQSQPKIRLIQSENNTLIEKIEGKYQTLMQKRMTDEMLPFDQRLQSAMDYIKTLATRERIRIDMKEKKKQGDNNPPRKEKDL